MTAHHHPTEALPELDTSEEKPSGFLEYRLRSTFRDLCRIYGFEGARMIAAEIINAEAERRR